jgi:hypothetical protein
MQGILDYIVNSVENGTPPPTYDEEHMGDETANYQRLAKRLSKIEENGAKSRTVETLASHTHEIAVTLGKIESGQKWLEKFLKYSVSAAFVWLVSLSGYLVSTMNKVSALESKGGSYTATEKALGKAQTPQEATANLNLLQAQIQKRSISKDPLSDVELAQVGVTLNATANRFPYVPAVWNVSSHLVNLRFDSVQREVPTDLPNCWDTYKRRVPDDLRMPNTPDTTAAIVDDQTMGNCVLTLDDDARFRNSGFGRAYEEHLVDFPNARLRFLVHDAFVTYSGTKLIPFSALACRNCIFRVSVGQLPVPAGQKVMRNLLTADLKDVTLTDSGV